TTINQGVNSIVGREHEPMFVVNLAYFNPGEAFKITIFYDGPLTRCTVNSRLPGVKIKITTEEDAQRRTAAIEELGSMAAKLTGAGTIAAFAAALSAAIAMFSAHEGSAKLNGDPWKEDRYSGDLRERLRKTKEDARADRTFPIHR
ncbi:MAG: hypothetical protein QOF22_544, partial [Bradyrhizobium sp.]|nr:hypothetical protein [Bradyrhizobium sp.]